MKFTAGYWEMRTGVQAYYPAQAYDVDVAPDKLTVYAPTHRINHRGDTLWGPMLTFAFTSPMPDVIRVRAFHWTGEKPRLPQHFDLLEQPPAAVTVTADEQAAVLTAGRLAVRVPRQGDWRLEFIADGRLITSNGRRGPGLVEVTGTGKFDLGVTAGAAADTAAGTTVAPAPYMHAQLALGVGEYVYGLGERFTAFVKNGQVVDIWNADGGTSSELAYKNVPFYLTSRGYGVFVNHPERVSFEVASERVSCVQFSVPGRELEYFVIYGPTPKEILEKYTALTGRPALPPAWSFGLWLTTSFTTSYDEATVTSFVQGMADRDLPLHVFHFDCFWMREFNWCDFEWDQRTFPDPPAMLARLKARGLRICVWINPYIAQRSPLFAEGARHGYLLKRPDGSVWQTDQWQAGMGIVDFTNPAARKWYGDKLRALLDMGVDCFKTDFGERIPLDVTYFDGSEPLKMHNYYTFLYNQTVFEVLRERRGEGEAVLFARSATAGSQRFPVHWGGDCESTFEAMAESLRGGLSLCLSGFGFWSHDIGGFAGLPPAEVYKRWLAFGLLSSHSRLHGDYSYRVPWLFDEEAVDVLRLFTKLKCRLMPYLYARAVECHERGVPLMRAMLLEFPGDPVCALLDRQYTLGEALLVVPVFSAAGEVEYYLPASRWTNYFTGEIVEGPVWRRETHGFLSLPLWVRPNTLLAVGACDNRPDYDYTDGVTLQLYALDEGKRTTAVIPTLNGEKAVVFEARREGRILTIEADRPCANWQVRLVGIERVVSVADGRAIADTLGTQIVPAAGVRRVTVTI